jgi:hypothetical protein
MAAEVQPRGCAVHARSDIVALGAVLGDNSAKRSTTPGGETGIPVGAVGGLGL